MQRPTPGPRSLISSRATPSSTRQLTEPATQMRNCQHWRWACAPRIDSLGTSYTVNNLRGANGSCENSDAARFPRRSRAFVKPWRETPLTLDEVTSPAAEVGTTGCPPEVSSPLSAYEIIVAGFPATIAFAGTASVTTAPGPTTARRPITTPGRTVALPPIDANRRRSTSSPSVPYPAGQFGTDHGAGSDADTLLGANPSEKLSSCMNLDLVLEHDLPEQKRVIVNDATSRSCPGSPASGRRSTSRSKSDAIFPPISSQLPL